jgi:pyruvate/2-oxoglutarate dehydrogenase complex dihydrolipoamide acyltransferase (E2) component
MTPFNTLYAALDARASSGSLWGGDDFEPRTTLPISPSYDHRVIDAGATRFLT